MASKLIILSVFNNCLNAQRESVNEIFMSILTNGSNIGSPNPYEYIKDDLILPGGYFAPEKRNHIQ